MKKIMFNDKYGLTDAVLQGRKTMTRRTAYDGEIKDIHTGYITEGVIAGTLALCDGCWIVAISKYKLGEVVAVAQAYKDIAGNAYFAAQCAANEESVSGLKYEKGWNNKMNVAAYYMPHHIRITDIRVERLQGISDEDCMREGIYRWKDMDDCPKSLSEIQRNRFGYYGVWDAFSTPRKAFADLIDKPGVGGKGTWERNPFVFAYTFELVNRKDRKL